MPTLGQLLRQERQKQNRNLADIASSTCISSRYLQAIEQDDFKQLPGGMFARSFVKQYCTALGLDPASFEREINVALPIDEPDPLPVLSETYQAPLVSKSTNLNTTWLVVLFVAAIAGSSGFYAWWQRMQHPAETPVETAVNTPPPAPVQQPVDTPAPVTPTPVPAPAPVTDASKVNLQLQATERTWVSLSADGKTVFAGTLNASERKDLEGLDSAKLTTGNAAGLDVRWNGKPLGPLGTRGQVRTIFFTPEKYEFVQPLPKKPVNPDSPDQRPTGVG